MQIQIDVNQDQFKDLLVALGSLRHHLPRHLRAAVSKTGASVRVQVAKALGQVMYLKSNDGKAKDGIAFQKAETLKKAIKRKNAPTLENPTVTIALTTGYDFPLKYYDAKPYIKKRKGKKEYRGVTFRYKPVNWSKSGTFKGVASDAFIIPKYGNNVYRRAVKGSPRLHRVVGPAPGDYYGQIGAKQIATNVARDRLPKEIKRRIRAIMLEQKGIIKLKTSRGSN
jgi:hypothetical protein